MYRLYLLVLIINLMSGPIAGQQRADSALVSSLLQDIAARQQAGNGFYFPGTFPCTRVHVSNPTMVLDDNCIFFTALIALGLRDLRNDLRGQDRVLCDTILARIPQAYPHFRNAMGRMTFNFWQTHPPVLFPGDPVLKSARRSNALPDDLDDTSVILAALDSPGDSVDRQVRAFMEAHANGTTGVLHTGYRRYRSLPAYSTWFGEKMPIDMDFSVLCNVLLWVCRTGLPFGRCDSASVVVLKDMLLSGENVSDPAFASPHYGRTPVLIYHVARLLHTCPIPALDSLKPLLISEAKSALPRARTYLDAVLLSTSLLWLGVPAPDIPPVALKSVNDADGDFVYFIASFSDYFRNPFRKVFEHEYLMRYEFRCVAFNRFLLLQYLLLRSTSQNGPHPGV